MRNLKRNVLLLLLFICFSGFCQGQHCGTKCKKVPLVDYTPYSYTADLQSAMKGEVGVGYVEYCADSIYAYFRHITYLPKEKSPIKYVREIKALDLKMTKGPIFDRFKHIVQTSDSIFFFSFFPNRPSIFDYEILGKYKNGEISYIDKEGLVFDNIRDLIDHKFGSIDRFAEAYLDYQEKALLCDYKLNGLHELHCIDDAIAQVNKDYNFYLYFNPENIDEAIKLFINQVDNILPLENKRDELVAGIMGKIAAETPTNFTDILMLNRQSCDDIFFAGRKINSVISEILSPDNYLRLIRGLKMQRAETMSAYDFLSNTFKNEILETGTGMMDDLSILNYLKRLLLAKPVN